MAGEYKYVVDGDRLYRLTKVRYVKMLAELAGKDSTLTEKDLKKYGGVDVGEAPLHTRYMSATVAKILLSRNQGRSDYQGCPG